MVKAVASWISRAWQPGPVDRDYRPWYPEVREFETRHTPKLPKCVYIDHPNRSLWSFGPLGTPFCMVFRGEDDGDIVEASFLPLSCVFLVFRPPECVLSISHVIFPCFPCVSPLSSPPTPYTHCMRLVGARDRGPRPYSGPGEPSQGEMAS